MRDFEKVYREQMGIRPTLRDILRVALAARRDRVSLVREEGNGKTAGVAVVMLGSPAISELGMFLKEHAREIEEQCGVHSNTPEARAYVGQNSMMETIFQWIDSRQPQWGWISTQINVEKDAALPVLIYIATANVTDALAAKLTEYGCITKLK